MVNVYDINIKKLDDRAIIPTYGSEFAAGADLYACMDAAVTVEPGQTVMVHTGIAMEIPAGFAGLVYARSGLASKKGLAPANKVGVIDADYRGEIMVALHNHGVSAQTVEQALLAEKHGADYLGVGAVFHTGTKLDADDVSFETLKAICQAVSIPVVAIGGITRDNLMELKGSDIAGVAVVSAIFAQKDIEAATRDLLEKTKEMVK